MRDSCARPELRPLRLQSCQSRHRSGWYFLLLRKLRPASGNRRRTGSFGPDSEIEIGSTAAAGTLSRTVSASNVRTALIDSCIISAASQSGVPRAGVLRLAALLAALRWAASGSVVLFGVNLYEVDLSQEAVGQAALLPAVVLLPLEL